MHSTFAFLVVLTAALVFGGPSSLTPSPANIEEGPTLCTLNSLPSDIQERLKADFGSWQLQAPENLSEHARKTWAGKKLLGCPGIAVGLFEPTTTPSYAFLLVPIDHPDAGYKFLVFTRKTGKPLYESTVVEKSDDPGASNFFIRKVLVSEFFSEDSKKKFQVQAAEAILMVDSAEQEYEADVYFWSNDRYRQERVDY
jgi:hypothetical protein